MCSNKRQRLSDDGEYEASSHRAIPVVFRVFAGKSHKRDDIELNIYGSAKEPTFLVSDIGKLGDLGSATNISTKCNELAGNYTFLYVKLHNDIISLYHNHPDRV
jgi:hypothetical protein